MQVSSILHVSQQHNQLELSYLEKSIELIIDILELKFSYE